MTSGDQVRPQRTTTPHPESKPVPLSGVHSNGTNERCAQQSTWYPTGTYMLVAAEPVGFVRAGSLSGRGVTIVKSTPPPQPSLSTQLPPMWEPSGAGPQGSGVRRPSSAFWASASPSLGFSALRAKEGAGHAAFGSFQV